MCSIIGGMEPLYVLHLRLASIGVIPWPVFSDEAYQALIAAVDAGELGRACIIELECEALPEAA
jgi:hypothetical protein